jgi:hypothetical protein
MDVDARVQMGRNMRRSGLPAALFSLGEVGFLA